MATHSGPGKVCRCDEAGWMPGIEHVPPRWEQPKWIRDRAGTMKPIAVVDHIMQGFLNTIVNWASNGESKIIVHFGIDRAGRIVQFQPVHTPGRHVSAISSPLSALVRARGQDAGTTGANGYTIGIEHEGCSVPLTANDGATIRNVTWSRSNPWPEPMVEASIRVKAWCFANVPSLGEPSRDTIIGHFEIDARNRPEDPAPPATRDVWPRDRQIAALAPFGGGEEERVVESNYGVVKPRETLGAFSRRVDVPVDRLVALNGLPNANHIQAWQVLRLREQDAAGNEVAVPPLLGFSAGLPDVRAVLTMVLGWERDTKARIGVLDDGVDGAIAELERLIAGVKPAA